MDVGHRLYILNGECPFGEEKNKSTTGIYVLDESKSSGIK